MHYTVPELMLLITAISAAIVSIITAWRTKGSIEAKVVNEANKTREEVKVTANEVKTVTEEVEKVHVLTNDRATKQDLRIEKLDEQIRLLIATIAEQDKQGAILADREERRILANKTSDQPNQSDTGNQPTQVVENQVVENQVIKKSAK